MRIEDIMTREVITAGFDDDLKQVRDLFTKYRFRHLPVVDDEGRLAGIISDRDMLANISPFAGTINERTVDANSLRRKAHQIMTRNPMTIEPREKAERAVLLMLHQRISSLPVVDGKSRVLGIVTMRDLMRWLLNRANIDPNRDAA
ncbi:MAG: CBS domain-containing protein [Phycisphaeraceae bacterium]|nr:CBS domain-containing protein [Phycisphaeraceae bacterium]